MQGVAEVTRTSRYKIFYFVMLGGVAVLSLWMETRYHLTMVGILLLALALLLPGRILGFFWRDLLRGLRLLNERKFEQSKQHSQLFLIDVRQRPWLKRLIWLGSGSYSRDPEAMALNNLGAAELMLGEVDAARDHFNKSMAVDDLNPLPFFNMGNLYATLGDRENATIWFSKAVALGYSQNAVDQILTASQNRFAANDGWGSFRS
jgi:tetratricopeptide (TPR) repeat protein